MKMKNKFIIALFLTSTLLAGCASIDISKLSNNPNIDNSTDGSDDGDSQYVDDGVIGENTLTISSDNYVNISSYSTGNYSNQYDDSESNNINIINNVSFMHYRGVSEEGYTIKLLPYYASADDGTLPGAIFNADKIQGITDIEIKYQSSSGLSLLVSQSKVYENSHSLVGNPLTEESSAINFRVRQYRPSFFKIETKGSDLYIKSISIKYTNIDESVSTDYLESGSNKTRHVISKINDLVDGETTITLKDKNGVDKQYTYYTTDYCLSNNEAVEDATLTDSIDVANYYLAFGVAPANYVNTTEASVDMTTLFGDNIRKCSDYYTRTDGYANAFSGELSNPQYIELDIALDNNYGLKSRGAGRVVIFLEGLSAYSDGGYVAFYTDDHYATFQEYLGDGTYSPRFNGQCPITSYKHSTPVSSVQL